MAFQVENKSYFLKHNHSNIGWNAYYAPAIFLNSNFTFRSINVRQVITSCTLNLHNVLCQIYLNKTGKELQFQTLEAHLLSLTAMASLITVLSCGKVFLCPFLFSS